MRTLLVALMAGVVGATTLPMAAGAQETKAAPSEAHEMLTQQHRMACTHARRIELAEAAEKESAAGEIEKLGASLDAASAQLDELAKGIGPEQAARVEAMRKSQAEAKTHYEQLKALADRPTSQAAKTQAAAVRDAIEAAEAAHQKLLAAPAPKPEAPKPDTTKTNG